MQALIEDQPLSFYVSQLKQLDKKLTTQHRIKLDSKAFLSAFVECAPVPIWIKDGDGIMRFINEAYEKIYGIDRLAYIGKKDSEVWGQDISQEFRKKDLEVMQGRTVAYAIEKVPNRAGFRQYDHLQVVKFPLYSGPEVIGIAGMITGVYP